MIRVPARPSRAKLISIPSARRGVCARRSRPATREPQPKHHNPLPHSTQPPSRAPCLTPESLPRASTSSPIPHPLLLRAFFGTFHPPPRPPLHPCQARRSTVPSVGQPADQKGELVRHETQHAVEPSCERRGEVSVSSAPPDNSAFNLANRQHADEKITRWLTVDP